MIRPSRPLASRSAVWRSLLGACAAATALAGPPPAAATPPLSAPPAAAPAAPDGAVRRRSRRFRHPVAAPAARGGAQGQGAPAGEQWGSPAGAATSGRSPSRSIPRIRLPRTADDSSRRAWSGSVSERLSQGREALEKGDHLEARRHFLAVLAIDPANQTAFSALQNDVKEIRFVPHTVEGGGDARHHLRALLR